MVEMSKTVPATQMRPKALDGRISALMSEGMRRWARSRAVRADSEGARMATEFCRSRQRGPSRRASPGKAHTETVGAAWSKPNESFSLSLVHEELDQAMGPPLLKLELLHASTSVTTPRSNRRIHLPASFLKACKLAAGDFVVVKPALQPEHLASMSLNCVPVRQCFMLAQAWPSLTGEDGQSRRRDRHSCRNGPRKPPASPHQDCPSLQAFRPEI
jgi:hypothetical protein